MAEHLSGRDMTGFPMYDLVLDMLFDWHVPGHAFGAYSCVCADFRHAVDHYYRNRALLRWPSLSNDEHVYGYASSYFPFPVWRNWFFQFWVFVNSERFGVYWFCMQEEWLNNLEEVSAAFLRVRQTAGLYQHIQIVLEPWVYDYSEPTWERENFV